MTVKQCMLHETMRLCGTNGILYNCPVCGWNPEVTIKRKARIRKELKQKEAENKNEE